MCVCSQPRRWVYRVSCNLETEKQVLPWLLLGSSMDTFWKTLSRRGGGL